MRALAVTVALVAAACGSGGGAPGAEAVPTTSPSTTTTTSAPRSAVTPSAAQFEAAVGEAFAEHDVPGMAVAVLRDGEIVFAGGFGVDPATGEPITAGTLLQAGSISKPVTAMAVATLVADGVLGWDDDVADLLSSFELANPFDAPVTVSRLLTHTGGTTVSGFLGYPADAVVPTVPDLLAGGGNSPAVVVEAEPGVGYSYSGGGYTVLQQALVDVTGSDFASLLAERVLGPAGTGSATFAQPLPPELRAIASSGSIGGEAVEPFVYPEQAAAGLWVSATDLARLAAALQGALAGRADWLPAAEAAALVEPVTSDLLSGVGRGFFVDLSEPPQWFFHPGRNTGFAAEMMATIDGRHGVVVLTNALEGEPLIRSVIDVIAGAAEWPPLPR